MIFGSREALGFEIEPLHPTWEAKSAQDRGPWAALTVWSQRVPLTECFSPGDEKLSRRVEVPLLPIADWFVRNAGAIKHEEFPAAFLADEILHGALELWNDTEPLAGVDSDRFEDERFDWYGRHFLLAGADGCLVPDLAFARIDGLLHVSWRPPHFGGLRQLQFTNPSGLHQHAWEDSWLAIGQFVRFVASEARARGIAEYPWLADDDPLERASRWSADLFASLVFPGFPDLLRRLGIDQGTNPESDLALQAARDLDLAAEEGAAVEALTGLRRGEGMASSQGFYALRTEFSAGGRDITPERSGYAAARAFRARNSLDGQALSDDTLDRMIKRLADVTTIRSTSARNNFVLGFDRQRAPQVILFEHARTIKPWAARMEKARAIGHLLSDAETSFGVMGAGSSQISRGPRRRRSGAFAAELLMPVEGIRRIAEGGSPADPDVFSRLMQHFQVGAVAATYHLWNRRMLNNEEERDALLEEYRSRG